jgi:6-phosphogluconolactonase
VARITVVDAAAFAATAAERITRLIEHSIVSRGSAFVCLTGGNTPRETYEALSDSSRPWCRRIDWSRIHLFWGDERHVPPDHPDSNFGMANRALVQRVSIPADHVHRIRAELPDAHDAADAYTRELPDRFDVMLLGLGDDCHIASIFPGSELLASESSWRGPRETSEGEADEFRPTGPARAVAVYAAHLGVWRITVTPRVILDSRTIVMLVSGEKKAAAVAAAIDGPLDAVHYPGQLLRDAGDRVEWMVDRSAASNLSAEP